MNFGAFAKKPLQDQLTIVQVTIVFLYGETGWIDLSQSRELLEQDALKQGSKLVNVPNASHQVFIENPEFFNKELCDSL